MTDRLRGRRIAVTGAGGRLGSVMTSVLAEASAEVLAWSRPRYDLDDPTAAARLVEADRPDLVVHCAAWVDVDGCARQPDLAERRNATAVAELAAVVARTGADLVLISTNEVFDGMRTDGEGYTEADPPSPASPYGSSKRRGEELAREAFVDSSGRLWVVRTSWLYSISGNDFPSKIVRAADGLTTKSLKVVDDEVGSPTSALHLSTAVATLVSVAPPGTYHRAGRDRLSRYEWALDIIRKLRPDTRVEPMSSSQFERASTPPPWGVLETTIPIPGTDIAGWRDVRGEFLVGLAARTRRPPDR